MNGLDKLVKMQKDGLIVVQPTDKSGGFAIFDRQDYIDGMETILKKPFGDYVNYHI